MIDKRIKDYFERKPNASYLFFAGNQYSAHRKRE